VQTGEDRVPSQTCRRQDEEVRDDHEQVEQEVVSLESHVLVDLVVEARAEVLGSVFVILKQVLLLITNHTINWLFGRCKFPMLVRKIGVAEVQEVEDNGEVEHQVVAHGVVIHHETQQVC
jgi:hypothetical protein